MDKVTLGAQTLLFPMPAVLVGSLVDGRPNFMTAAWCGIACGEPPSLAVAIRHPRHTLKGIRENGQFSINVPSSSLVRETDLCGLVTGAKEDKVALCSFEVFYGKLSNAPMVKQCPVNLECSVHQEIDLGSHVLVIGRIEQTHVSSHCLTEGKPDVEKIDPIMYISGVKRAYHAVGRAVAQAFKVGLELKR
jgi:flavin reductase (DIM6/NTAB) family NADH-FMN oxidoreductase RutF